MVVKGFRDRETGAWQRTRFGAYMVYCSVTESEKRESIYKFFPLRGDPKQEEQSEEELMDEYQEAMNWFKKTDQQLKPNAG